MLLVVFFTIPEAPPFWPIHTSALFYYQNHTFVFLSLLWQVTNLCWIYYVLHSQVKCILDNITQNEIINFPRYTYLQKTVNGQEPEYWNRFDEGLLENIKEFFWTKWDYFNMFEIPKEAVGGGRRTTSNSQKYIRKCSDKNCKEDHGSQQV